MKITLVLFLSLTIAVLVSGCAFAQVSESHTWTVKLKVVDDDGTPVTGAAVAIAYPVPRPPNQTIDNGEESSARVKGLTDTSGIFVVSHSSQPGFLGFPLGIRIQKEGYYSSWIQHDFGPGYDTSKWNPSLTLVLKKIGKPIPMYARQAQIELPAVDKPIGFDLMKYDWVAPYGKGEQSDIVFETHRNWVSRHDFDSTLRITFLNPNDGLLIAPVLDSLGSSGPRIAVTAPLNGYIPELERELGNSPTSGWKNDSKDQNYYLRLRTVLDENGNVKSALYGKFYGDFTLDPINSQTTLVLFTYYLNPTPNSRNVEFDPQKNLFENLPDKQQVSTP